MTDPPQASLLLQPLFSSAAARAAVADDARLWRILDFKHTPGDVLKEDPHATARQAFIERALAALKTGESK